MRSRPPGVECCDASAWRELDRRPCALLDAHLTADGVLFDSRAWIVTTRRDD